MRERYSRSGDNAKMKAFTFARNEDDLTDNSRTPTGTKIYFRSPSPSPSQNSLVLKFSIFTQPLIFVGCSVHYWVSCANNKGGFFDIAFVVVVDTHVPRFEALAYVLLHFDALTQVVVLMSSASSLKPLLRSS